MMKIKSALLFGILAHGVLPLFAQNPIVVPWNRVCETAYRKQLIVTTNAGESLQGYCFSIDADEIAVKTKDRGVVRIARRSLSRLQLYSPSVHPFLSLQKDVRIGLIKGVQWLFSPAAPLGIVTISGTLAWGAVSAPFCLLGELKHKPASAQEIKPM